MKQNVLNFQLIRGNVNLGMEGHECIKRVNGVQRSSSKVVTRINSNEADEEIMNSLYLWISQRIIT